MLSFIVTGLGLRGKDKAHSFQLNPSPAHSGDWALPYSVGGPLLLSCSLVPSGSSQGWRGVHSPSTHTDPFLAQDKTTQHTQEASGRTNCLGPGYSHPCPIPSAQQLCPLPISRLLRSRAGKSTKGYVSLLSRCPASVPHGYRKECGPSPLRFDNLVEETRRASVRCILRTKH